jgi:ribonuclease P protein component
MAPDLSFTKEERLKSPRDFKRVYSRGKRVRTRSFVVYALPNGFQYPRLGLSVSARTANSPGRARIKRLLREFFRLNKTRFSTPRVLPAATGATRATGASRRVPPGKSKTTPRELSAPRMLSAPSARPAVPAPPGLPAGFEADALDVVISAKTPAATLGLKDVEEEITEALSRLNRAFL